MDKNDLLLLRRFSAKIKDAFANPQIWAFGSRVRGTAVPESDLDICVVLDNFNSMDRALVSEIAWEAGFDAGVVISTIVFTREEFENGPPSASPLVQAIRLEGIAA